ncbi:terminase TerL endonuclease subunit [Orenia marismortui]|uniref:Phage terminase large subunit-like protein n=1 Tax=Orenia marismortui TaxID=46469 RepID=A0A4R8HA21_9FIRM|nr:terminase TerL endonuclease subunit [Orenia marismortui]TDX52148.1 phage terminase large subunit-like protein [Orenia marismortui]
MPYKYHKYIDSYISKIRSEEIPASKELKQAMDYIDNKLSDDDVVIKVDMIDKAVELIEKYFEFKLLNWELFIIALMHCYYESKDMVVFDEFFIMMGRGNGKNGFISPLVWYLTTHYHGVDGYNVDIIANNESQAQTSFFDVYNILERYKKKLKHFFYWTKEKITNTRTNSYIKYNTSNARTKDGKRSACLVFDETHEFEDYASIKVFTSGFGKRKHSRIFYITTDGYVRGGVIDDQKDLARRVLSGEIENLGLLPLIYKIDEKEEAKDPEMWTKACPSLPYFPELQKQMYKESVEMEYRPYVAQDFYTKRMNFPAQDNFTIVAPWEKIEATNKPIPYEKLKGLPCIGAIDYAHVNDFVSCGLLFKYNGMRYWIEHTFVCHLALEMESRHIKFPVKEMEGRGLITVIPKRGKVDSITAEDVSGWFLEQAKKYNIQNIYADKFRYKALQSEFTKQGLPLEWVRSGPITHAQVAPLVESVFSEEKIIFGDNPTMRWYVNNTKTETDKKGNTTYLKIEPKTRKTDGFFALLHALSKDDELEEQNNNFMSLDVYTY